MENEEKFPTLELIFSVIKWAVFFLIAISVVGSGLYPLYLASKAKQADYDEYGCYRVVKEYELCGPVEGKPGFTVCEKMTKKVCPNQE